MQVSIVEGYIPKCRLCARTHYPMLKCYFPDTEDTYHVCKYCANQIHAIWQGHEF